MLVLVKKPRPSLANTNKKMEFMVGLGNQILIFSGIMMCIAVRGRFLSLSL